VELVDVAQSAAEAMKRVLLLLALVSCEKVFSLETVVRPSDGPMPPFDGAGDGFIGTDALFTCTDVANHDEDGDGLADDVDNCPEASNPGQESVRDGDGIGDVCDPNATIGTDSRVLWVSFASASSCWEAAGTSAWTFHDDAAYVMKNSAGYAYAIANLPPPAPGIVYRAHVVVDTVSSANKGTFALVANKNSLSGQILSCALIHDPSTTDIAQTFLTGTNESHVAIPVMAGTGYTVELHYDATSASCRVMTDTGTAVVTGTIHYSSVPVDQLALAAEWMSAHVDWVAIYRHP
jgi:hypothetical protein